MTETIQPSPETPIPAYLRRDEAARYVRTTYNFPCSTRWLAKLAVVGGGPAYSKAGRTPLYTLHDLDAWARQRIRLPQHSTVKPEEMWNER
ncbi:hypothetical protein RDV64_17465 [Acuticoccus sp. MNP-M23]|uniref:hypothetical protein n=1 Tax=Acuticoccus sp. MNP-M23 TaxID=3072793 RepID=UPI0028150825|nr:hypothetical protein [Acuticoccus sp. MNP-M23]WMS41839.1 hypothetical protein RDV64_17465 [Acuticoccus sp. MNP-M23]